MADRTYNESKNALQTNISSALAANASNDYSSGVDSAAYSAYSSAVGRIDDLTDSYSAVCSELTAIYDTLAQLLNYSVYQADAMRCIDGFSKLSKLITRIFGDSSGFDKLAETLQILYKQYLKETDSEQKTLILYKIMHLIERYSELFKSILGEMSIIPSDTEVSFNSETGEIEAKSNSSMAFESTISKKYAAWKGKLDKSGWVAQSCTIYAKSVWHDANDAARLTEPIRISIPLLSWSNKEYQPSTDASLWWVFFNKQDYNHSYTEENDGDASSSPFVTKNSSFRIGSAISSLIGEQTNIYTISSSGEKVYFRTGDTMYSAGTMTSLNGSGNLTAAYTDKSMRIQCKGITSDVIARQKEGTMFEADRLCDKIELQHIVNFGGDDSIISGTLSYDAGLTESNRESASATAELMPKYFKQAMYMQYLSDSDITAVPYEYDENGETKHSVFLMKGQLEIDGSADYSKITAIKKSSDGYDISYMDGDVAKTMTVTDTLDAGVILSAFNAISSEEALYGYMKNNFSDANGVAPIKQHILVDNDYDAMDNALTQAYVSMLTAKASGFYFSGTITLDDDSSSSSTTIDASQYSDSSASEYSLDAAETAESEEIQSQMSAVGNSGAKSAKVVVCIQPSSSGDNDKVDITCSYEDGATINKTDYGNGLSGIMEPEDRMLFGGEFAVTDVDITSSVILDGDDEKLAAYLQAIDLLDPTSDDFDALLAKILSAIEGLRASILSMLKAYLTKINGAITSVTSAKAIYASSDPNFSSEYISDLIDMYSTASTTLSGYLAADGFDLEDIYDGTVYNKLIEEFSAIDGEYSSMLDDAKSAIESLKSTKAALTPIVNAKYSNPSFASTMGIFYGILRGTNASYETLSESNSAVLSYATMRSFADWDAYFKRVVGQVNRFGATAEAITQSIINGTATAYEATEEYEYLDFSHADEALLYALTRVFELYEYIGTDFATLYRDALKYMKEISLKLIVSNMGNDKFMLTVNSDVTDAIVAYSKEFGDANRLRHPNSESVSPALIILYPGASEFNRYDLRPDFVGNMDDANGVKQPKGKMAARSLAYKLILSRGAANAESDLNELGDIIRMSGLSIRDYYLIYALCSAYSALAPSDIKNDDDKLLSNADGLSETMSIAKRKIDAYFGLASIVYADTYNGIDYEDAGSMFTSGSYDNALHAIAANNIVAAAMEANSDFDSIRTRLSILGYDSMDSIIGLLTSKIVEVTAASAATAAHASAY